MKIDELMQGIAYHWVQGPDQDIQGISYDSRRAGKACLFVCIPGFKTDGHQYIEQAVANGATAILAQHRVELPETVTLLTTEDTRRALPVTAANFYGHPSRQIHTIGITGTNGKTTTSHIIQAILEKWGKRTGIMGTLYARIDDEIKDYGRTTPEASEIQAFLADVTRHNGDYMVMEVSSHALDLHRVDEIYFTSAVFTNLTQDHLDYHQSMEIYRACKVKLFEQLNLTGGTGILNRDDPAYPFFRDACPAAVISYGLHQDADVQALDVQTTVEGTRFNVVYQGGEFPIQTPLIGLFSVYNALAAIAFALQEGVEPALIQRALQDMQGVPGRFEQVDCGQDFTVVVDYAHTPDGLKNILKTGRDLTENRLITVFGCGGDRDRSKRPRMGEIAARYSDFSIVTSDNPRTEAPDKIIDDIVPGLEKVRGSRYAVVPDRREAIHTAITIARPGDLIIIAGKGHESYQLINEQIIPFDDRKVAAEYLKGLKQE